MSRLLYAICHRVSTLLTSSRAVPRLHFCHAARMGCSHEPGIHVCAMEDGASSRCPANGRAASQDTMARVPGGRALHSTPMPAAQRPALCRRADGAGGWWWNGACAGSRTRGRRTAADIATRAHAAMSTATHDTPVWCAEARASPPTFAARLPASPVRRSRRRRRR